MKHILVHIKMFNSENEHDVWVSTKYDVIHLIQKLEKLWLKGEYKYQHTIYLKEDDRFLDVQKTLFDNDVVEGDHLVLY